MTNEELKKLYRLRDKAVRVISKDKKIRAVAIKNTNAVKLAQIKHHLAFVPAFLLARHLTAASMLASFLKGEERITIESMGDGPCFTYFRRSFASW